MLDARTGPPGPLMPDELVAYGAYVRERAEAARRNAAAQRDLCAAHRRDSAALRAAAQESRNTLRALLAER